MRIRLWSWCVTVSGIIALSGLIPVWGEEPAPHDLTRFYGFKPLEIFKLEQRSGNLLAADMNQDGRTDLLLVDNSHSRIDLLVQRAKPSSPPIPAGPRKVNQIESDRRFEHRKLGVDRELSALVVGDFNQDGKKDLAYFAVPDQLVVRLQNAEQDWTVAQRFRLPDVQPGMWMLAAGDLNHDERDDLVVFGKSETYLIYQQPDGTLAAPVSLLNTTSNLRLAQIADLDGDGRNDLSYLTPDDSDRPFGARLQGPDGQLGPELRCEMGRPRGVTLANVDGKPGSEVLSLESQTGRVKIHQLQRGTPRKGELANQLIQYGLGAQGGRNRDLATGDVNGDGLADVVVTDPESAQMFVFLQRKEQGLDLGKIYPGLMGSDQVRIANVDEDPLAEVIVLSAREKAIGVSKMQQGRLTFPQPLPVAVEPLAFELLDWNGDGVREIFCLGKNLGQSSYSWQLLQHKDGKWQAVGLEVEPGHPVEKQQVSLKGTPDRLAAIDANRDGKTDFLIFYGGDRAPQLLLQNANGKGFSLLNEKGVGLGNIAPGNFFVGHLGGPALLAAQNNFARNMELGPNHQWRIVDQYNAGEPEARIAAAATLDLDGRPGNEIALIDQGVKKIRVLRKEGSVYRPWKEVDIGSFPFKAAHVADLNGDGRADLLLLGSGKFGILYSGQADPRLKSLASFETQLEKTHFQDLAAGDLNGDGYADLAVFDTQSQFVEILDYAPATGLRHALYFKVFESKNFGGEDRSGSEPREGLIADVTGDGKADLVLLSHDRVLIYPQDTGK